MDPRLVVAIGDVRTVTRRFTAHRSSLVAGGLAFFVALSIAPAALATGRIAGLLLNPEQVRSVLDSLAGRSPLGSSNGQVTEALITLVESGSTASVTVTTFVSLLVAVYAASRVVIGMQMALSVALGRPERYRGIAQRVLATAFTLLGIIAVAAALIVLTVIPTVLRWLGVSLTLTTGVPMLDWLLFALLLWIGIWALLGRPGATARLRVSIPPLLATVWVLAASAGVGIYVRFSASLGASAVVFGSAIVVLLWLYLCFVGILLAAEWLGWREQQTRT